jgi:hypothetical protein
MSCTKRQTAGASQQIRNNVVFRASGDLNVKSRTVELVKESNRVYIFTLQIKIIIYATREVDIIIARM